MSLFGTAKLHEEDPKTLAVKEPEPSRRTGRPQKKRAAMLDGVKVLLGQLRKKGVDALVEFPNNCRYEQVKELAALANQLKMVCTSPENCSSSFYSTSARVAAALHGTSVDNKVDLRAAVAAYHDRQRQRACAARFVIEGRVSVEDAKGFIVEGSLETLEERTPMMSGETVPQEGHRCKDIASVLHGLYTAAVARKVPRHEWTNPKAKAALDKEWNRQTP